jgi:hypothetical protein
MKTVSKRVENHKMVENWFNCIKNAFLIFLCIFEIFFENVIKTG